MKKLYDRFFGPEQQIKRMQKDLDYILGSLTQGHYGPVEDLVARDLAKDLAYVKATFIGRDTHGHARAEDHFKRLHKEARRRASQRDLTSITLGIMYVQADAHGDLGQNIVDQIDAFLADWKHLIDEDDDGSATGAARSTNIYGDGGMG